MNKKDLYKKYLLCPSCGGEFESKVCGKCGKELKFIDGDIPDFFEETSTNKLSQQKWEEYFENDVSKEEIFKEVFLDDVLRQLLGSIDIKKGVYLEIGCGQGFIGEDLAKKGWFFIGVDYSEVALLQLKKRLLKRGVSNFLLVKSDIKKLPIKSSSIDLIYGGGVIEHLKDYQDVINHLCRVLKPGGVTFNTVPFFNIGNLVYRSFWGGIPNIPVLKQVTEFIHVKLLGGKHMTFGYELQFTSPQLIKMHTNAGFKRKEVRVDRFDCHLFINFVKNEKVKGFFINLCKTNRNFWPMVKVVARKL